MYSLLDTQSLSFEIMKGFEYVKMFFNQKHIKLFRHVKR